MEDTEFGRAARAIAAAARAVRPPGLVSLGVDLTGSIDRHISALREFGDLHASAGVRRDRLVRNCAAWRMTTELSLPSREALGRIAADIVTDAEWFGTNY